MRKAKVTKSGGMSNLALYEKINVLDFFSDGSGGSHDDEESPQIENKSKIISPCWFEFEQP